MHYKTGEFGSKLPGKEAERNTVSYIIFIVQLRQRILTHCVEAAVAEIWNQAGIYNMTPCREDMEGSRGPSLTVYEESLLNPFAWRALWEVAQKLTVRHQLLSKANVYAPTGMGGGIVVTLRVPAPLRPFPRASALPRKHPHMHPSWRRMRKGCIAQKRPAVS